MTGKLPFPELSSAGIITMAVIQGNVPSALEHAQLSQITRLCSLMTDCWAFDPQVRPSISRCRNEVDCMVRARPLGREIRIPNARLVVAVHTPLRRQRPVR